MSDYKVYGVKELLKRPHLTPDEMAQFTIEIVQENGESGYTKFFDYEIQVEFMLRALGYKSGEEKENKRIEMLKESGYEQMVEFWQKAMG